MSSSSLPAQIAAIAYGQNSAGELRLTVNDPSGAGMQASGTLDNNAFKTDAQGHYDFRDLAPGGHRLSVSAPGFATQAIPVEVLPHLQRGKSRLNLNRWRDRRRYPQNLSAFPGSA